MSHTTAAFDFVRYASVWEDADVLCEALAPVARGGRLLSIASAGDNALALLTLDPAEVVAVDLNLAQLACLELRIAAFRALDDRELLEFLGMPPETLETPAPAIQAASVASPTRMRSDDATSAPKVLTASDPVSGKWRNATYARLRPALPTRAAQFWDAHPGAITGGIAHAGKFERYFHGFRRFVLPLVHGSDTVAALRASDSPAAQERFYRERWDTWRWRALFRVFFSRFVMGRLGRDPQFFTHVDGPVATRILERTRHALTRIPVASNPYLAYIVTGNFRRGALPRYVRAEHRDTIRARLDRVRIVEGPAETVDGPFDGYNLSDIFEYMSPADHTRVYTALVDRARPGARLVYWNMLAPRARPASLADRVRPMESLACELHERDQAWFYQRLHVDEVIE